MDGYSPKLPLIRDADDGLYGLNKSMFETIRQNLKMLLLTNPGERIMDNNFGVGIRNYIFSQDIQQIRTEITARINKQVSTYLNYISIDNIELSPANSNEENILFIRYNIKNIPSFTP